MTNSSDPTKEQQSSLLTQSENAILVIIIATLISYYQLDIQKKALICATENEEIRNILPDALPLRVVSDILIICALSFFAQLSGQQLKQDITPHQKCKNKWNHISNLLVLTAALIRFFLLLDQEEE